MAGGTGLDLRRRSLAGWPVPLRYASGVSLDEAPAAARAVAQDDLEPLARVFVSPCAGLCPGHVRGAAAMAALAADADLGPGRVVAVVRRIVAALQAGGMAGRAHEIPGLV